MSTDNICDFSGLPFPPSFHMLVDLLLEENWRVVHHPGHGLYHLHHGHLVVHPGILRPLLGATLLLVTGFIIVRLRYQDQT